MFVEEFCRFRGVDIPEAESLRVTARHRNPVGFMTDIEPTSVADSLNWNQSVYPCLRVPIVDPTKTGCGVLFFFDAKSMKPSAIEGFVCGERWPKIEEPAYWSKRSVVDLRTAVVEERN